MLSCNVAVSYVTGLNHSESKTPRILTSAHFGGLKCLASRSRPLYPWKETPVLTKWDNNLCLKTICRNWRRENQLSLQWNKLRSLGLAVRSQPLLLELHEENVGAWPLTAMLLMLHTRNHRRPPTGASRFVYRTWRRNDKLLQNRRRFRNW